MKKITLLAVALFAFAFNSLAQGGDKTMIGFHPLVVNDTAPSNVASYIENQVLSILTGEGIAHSGGDFVFEISVNEISKQITATAPPRTMLRMEVVVKAVDRTQEVVLNSITLSCSGLANNNDAAYMDAARSLSFRSRNFINFIEVSKNRLMEYYGAGYAKSPKDEPAAPAPHIKPTTTPEPEPAANEPRGVKIAEGLYVEYIKTEKKSQTTDVILKFTNYNPKDEKLSFKYKSHMIVDKSGQNLNSRDERYLNGDKFPFDGIVLLQEVPVSVRIEYVGDVDPQVLFLNEAHRDVKVRIDIK